MTRRQGKERRQWVRAKRVLNVEYRLSSSKSKTKDAGWHVSTTKDMSIGGMAFYTEEEYRPGDILEIRIAMSGTIDIYKGPAKVVRTVKRRTGAHYLTAVAFISAKVKSRRAKSYAARK